MDNNLYVYEPAHFSREEFNKAERLKDFLHYLDALPRLHAPNINLVIRPRGFGLTLAMQSLETMLSTGVVELKQEQELKPPPEPDDPWFIRYWKKRIEAKSKDNAQHIEDEGLLGFNPGLSHKSQLAIKALIEDYQRQEAESLAALNKEDPPADDENSNTAESLSGAPKDNLNTASESTTGNLVKKHDHKIPAQTLQNLKEPDGIANNSLDFPAAGHNFFENTQELRQKEAPLFAFKTSPKASPDSASLKQQRGISVIHLSLKRIKSRTVREFESELLKLLQNQMWEHHIKTGPDFTRENPGTVFFNLIKSLFEKSSQAVVVLIDNYDIPFINAATLPEEYRKAAVAVYLDMLNALKRAESMVRFVLMTGHIKFELTSEISEGLPCVTDLSYRPEIDTLFGFTIAEVREIFASELERLAPRNGITVMEMLKALDDCYGHFVFSDRMIPVLCPASVHSCLENEGTLLPYVVRGEYAFLKQAIDDNADADLSWLVKDGQEALFHEYIPLSPNADDLGVLLLQLGFVTIDKVTVTEEELFTNYRYRFAVTNEEMRRFLQILLKKSDPRLGFVPINALVINDSDASFDY